MRWWWGSLCTRPTELDFYSASSLKQQSAYRYVPTQTRYSVSISSRGWLMCNCGWYRYHHVGGWYTAVTDIDSSRRWLMCNRGWFRYCDEGGSCASVTDIDIVTQVLRWWWGSLCTRPTELDFYRASSLKQQSAYRYVPTQTRYSESETISFCSFSLMLCA
jgi:hypothetical protein